MRFRSEDLGSDPTIKPTASGDSSKIPLMIFYGTETGNAESFAKIAEGEAEGHGFEAHLLDLEHFVPEMLTGDLSACDKDTRSRVAPMIAPGGPIAMFFIATCGDGDPTANARDFFSWLKGEDCSDDASRDLSKLRFGVFGLGNTGYEHFNAAGKTAQAGLEKLGGNSVVELGLGDDNGELEAQCEDWRLLAWPAMQRATASDLGGGAAESLSAAAGVGDEESWRLALPAPTHAPFKIVPLEPPSKVTAADTARDDLRASGNAAAADLAEAAVGGKAAAVGDASAWVSAEPLRLLSRNQLMAMGAGSDPVRAKWFEAVPARVTACKEVRQAPSEGASTVHVEIDVGSACIAYGTAHNASVLPENSPEQVRALCTWLDLNPAQWFTIEGDAYATALARADAAALPAEPLEAAAAGKPGARRSPSLPAGQRPVPFPVPCTLGHALLRYCDLGGAATKACAGQLAHFARSESEQRRLAHLVSVEGRSDWEAWVRKPRRSILELFQAFPSISIPPAQLLHVLPPLKPREYTIASSALAHPGSMHLAVSVLSEAKPPADTKDAPDRRLRGVCSSYLSTFGSAVASGPVGAPLARVTVRSSAFNLPPSVSTPVIMVGPGTGLAPMRAFCQEREAQLAAGAELGPALLFFGCRRSTEDFIYREELEAWAASGVLTELHTAFSRESDTAKVYVQHRLKEQAPRIWELVKHQGAHVYVCGATAMGSEVLSALATIAATEGGLSEAEALGFVQQLEHEDRLVQELWA